MLTQILPDTIESSLHTVNLQHINEIRMRVDKPVMVSLKGKNFFLSSYGITADYASAIICDKNMIDYILAQASNNSLYTIHDQLVLLGLIKAKGFDDVIVSTSTSTLNVIVKSAELTSAEVAQIVDVVKSQTNYSLDNIRIIPVE